MAHTVYFDCVHRWGKLLEKCQRLLAVWLLAQDWYIGGIHPVELKNRVLTWPSLFW
jgi:hypothetical protein